jgi:hypothetical protein
MLTGPRINADDVTLSGGFFNNQQRRKICTVLYRVVPDGRCRILKVVLVRRLATWVLGIWRGEGLGKG